MTTVVLAGALIGLGVYLAAVAVFPARTDPAQLLALFDAAQDDRVTRSRARAEGLGWLEKMLQRIGHSAEREAAKHSIFFDGLRADYALAGQDLPDALGRKVVAAAVVPVTVAVCVVVLGVVGVAVPWWSAVTLVVGLSVAMFFVPDIEARRIATRRRAEFVRSFAAYLDWVALQMSGRVAAEQAVPDAASLGTGWPLVVIRHTVSTATNSGGNVWDAFERLGAQTGIRPMADLGTVVRQVAQDGSEVRKTLQARAESLRATERAALMKDSGRRSQNMLLAEVLVAAGYMVFLAYPAIIQVLKS